MAAQPPTANQALFDALVRHQTYLLRYSGYVRNRIWSILDKSEEDVAAKILVRLRSVEAGAPVEVRRMWSLIESVRGMRSEAWQSALAFYEDEMQKLAYQEPITFDGILKTVAPVLVETTLPAARLLKSIALSRPFEGRVLKEWVSGMEAADLARVHSQIQIGMVAGETGPQITRRVIGTEALKGKDGVTQLTRQQVDAITRTAVMHVANNARAEMLAENADLMVGERYVATLDARTTAVCKANDGKVFPVGVGPRPPLHIACRSLRVAAYDGDVLAQRPYKASTEKQLVREYKEMRGLDDSVKSRGDLPRGHKGNYDDWSRRRVREMTGRVPDDTSYQKWLEKQPKSFQDDTLGITKGKLFRDGGLKLDQYVAADGSELTLTELATRHPAAFRAAGLDPHGF